MRALACGPKRLQGTVLRGGAGVQKGKERAAVKSLLERARVDEERYRLGKTKVFLGVGVLDWDWSSRLLVEGWMVGLFWGAFFFMRKELRYRFTLEQEGLPVPDGWGD